MSVAQETLRDLPDSTDLSDVVPPVSMDIDLGKLGKQLDFDQVRYRDYLKQRGEPRPGDIHIHFVHQDKNPRLSGEYIQNPRSIAHTTVGLGVAADVPDRQINVYIPQEETPDPDNYYTREESANRTLLHESEHHIQDLEGELNLGSVLRGMILMKLAPIIGSRLYTILNMDEKRAVKATNDLHKPDFFKIRPRD